MATAGAHSIQASLRSARCRSVSSRLRGRPTGDPDLGDRPHPGGPERQPHGTSPFESIASWMLDFSVPRSLAETDDGGESV